MTMSNRPRVLTEQDAGTMDTLIRRGEQAATVAEQKTQQLQDAAADLEQVKGTIPAAAQSAAALATAQAKATLDAATLNATTAATQATLALATLPKFRSVDVNNPTAPTQAELDANPNGLGGTRLTADGATQPLRWTPHTLAGAWVTMGAPTATAPQVEAARALAAQADTKADSASNALGNLALTTLATRAQGDGPQLADGSRWVWAAAADGREFVAAAGGGVWVRESGAVRDGYAHEALTATEGFPLTRWRTRAAYHMVVPDDDTDNRYWPVVGSVRSNKGSDSHQDMSGVRGQVIGGHSAARGWGVVGMAHTDIRYMSGGTTVTAGSTAVTGTNTQFLSELRVGEAICLAPPGEAVRVRGVVASIESDTSLTLRDPWGFASSANNTQTYAVPDVEQMLLMASELDVNNYSGLDASSDAATNLRGLAIVSGGPNRAGVGLHIYAPNAPFFNGVFFDEKAVYNTGILFGPCNPVSGAIRWRDDYQSPFGLSQKNGVLHEFRAPGGNMYHWAAGNTHAMSVGSDGWAVMVSPGDQTPLLRVTPGGEVLMPMPGAALYMVHPSAGGVPVQMGGDRRLVVDGKPVGTRAAALTAPAPAAAAGGTPTKAEYDAVVARLADLEAKMRDAGLLS